MIAGKHLFRGYYVLPDLSDILPWKHRGPQNNGVAILLHYMLHHYHCVHGIWKRHACINGEGMCPYLQSQGTVIPGTESLFGLQGIAVHGSCMNTRRRKPGNDRPGSHPACRSPACDLFFSQQVSGRKQGKKRFPCLGQGLHFQIYFSFHWKMITSAYSPRCNPSESLGITRRPSDFTKVEIRPDLPCTGLAAGHVMPLPPVSKAERSRATRT